MNRFEQEPIPDILSHIQLHEPCILDAKDFINCNHVPFKSLASQIEELTHTIGNHRDSHKMYNNLKKLLDPLTPDVQQSLLSLLNNYQQAIIETDSNLPLPMQKHQPGISIDNNVPPPGVEPGFRV